MIFSIWLIITFWIIGGVELDVIRHSSESRFFYLVWGIMSPIIMMMPFFIIVS